MILAGDIGGTKTVLALYCENAGRLEPIRETTYGSKEFQRFDQVLNQFLSVLPDEPIDAICLGVAGPVKDGQCKTTNLPWVLDEQDLSRRFYVEKVRLLNDVEATAFGMLFLPESEMATLNEGTPARKGNIAVISAGTGLGEGWLCWDGQNHFPVASEGGNADFAPQNDQQIELLRFLRKEFGHVSCERVISGPGIFNIYRFLRDTGLAPEPVWLREQLQQGDKSATITQIGLARDHPLCTETVDLFTSLYGAEAGNLALKGMAIGGVYIGGGIAPKLLEKLKEGNFIRAFWDKGRYSDLMKEIPVKVSLNSHAPLIGAAHYALRI